MEREESQSKKGGGTLWLMYGRFFSSIPKMVIEKNQYCPRLAHCIKKKLEGELGSIKVI